MSDLTPYIKQFSLPDKSVITRVSFDMGVRLLVGSPDVGSSEIVVYATYEIHEPSGRRHFAHAQARADSDILLLVRLLGREVTAIAIAESGELHLVGDAWRLIAGTDLTYEPWGLTHLSGFTAHGLPGSDVEWDEATVPHG